MYGATEVLPLLSTSVPVDIDPFNPFNEDYKENTQFWEKVDECFEREKENGLSWITIETRLRLEKLKERYEGPNIPDNEKQDTLVTLLTIEYQSFEMYMMENDEFELKDSFVRQLSEFAEILLQEDFDGYPMFPINEDDEIDNEKQKVVKRTDGDRKYANLINFGSDGSKSSILHLAAKRDLCQIADYYLKLYPAKVCRSDRPKNGDRKKMAAEVALDLEQDAVCELLMKSMLNERVRMLFEGPSETSPGSYKLTEIIANGKMKATVLAVLDSCVNPSFPYTVKDPKQKEREEEAWSKISGMPLRYNFYFRILDGDDEGKPAKLSNPGVKNGVPNEAFKYGAKSPFHVISNNGDASDDQDPIRHPLVRQLVRKKWKECGEPLVWVCFCVHLVFLLAMSVALFLAASSQDPLQYNSALDKLRGVCEVVTLLLTFLYLIEELLQVIGDFQGYVADFFYNTTDIVGLLLILALIPCHFYASKAVRQTVSVFVYFINFIRVFKFFPVLRDYGIYVKTFMQIIVVDIRKFMVVFAVVMFAFAGSIYLAMSTSKNSESYWEVLLKGVRALVEGKEFADDYDGYSFLLLFLILLNMMVVIVIMANILIGQLSYRYENAMNAAEMQLNIDQAKLLTQIERNWLTARNRVRYYKDGIFVSEGNMVSDLLKDWNSLQSTSSEDTKTAVMSMLQKRILKRK